MDNQQGQGTRPEDGRGAAAEGQAASRAESPAASRIADDMRERMASLRPQAAEGVEHAADAVRQAAGSLRGQEAWLAQLVDQGADKLSDLAQTLRTNDLQT